MGKKTMLFSDLTGDVYPEDEGAKVRVKMPDGKNVELDAKPSELENLSLTNGDGETVAVNFLKAGREVAARGRKPATASA